MAKKLPIPIDADEFAKLIKNTKYQHWRVAFLLGFGAGLRISEVVKLQPGDINMKERKMFIRQAKGSKDRIVPVPKAFKPSCLKYIPMSCGCRALQSAFHKCSEKAGLLANKPDLHFHSLRHGFANQCISNGMPIHHLRTLMGHSNISTTNVYLEVNPKHALASYEEFF